MWRAVGLVVSLALLSCADAPRRDAAHVIYLEMLAPDQCWDFKRQAMIREGLCAQFHLLDVGISAGQKPCVTIDADQNLAFRDVYELHGTLVDMGLKNPMLLVKDAEN